AFVRGVLIDEHYAIFMLEHYVSAPKLHQRRNTPIFVSRVDSGAVARFRFVNSTDNGVVRFTRHAKERRIVRVWRENVAFDYLDRLACRRNSSEERPAHRCGAVERTERAPHGALDRALDGPAILKSDLGLGRMNVDVDGVDRNGDFQIE